MLVIIVCIASSFVYAFLAAFYITKEGTPLRALEIFFEVVCGIDILVKFILEYKPDDSIFMVRDLYKIAVNYVKTAFIYDLLPMIPFHIIFDGELVRLFHLIKIIRIRNGFELIGSN